MIGRRARELKLDLIHDPTGTAPLYFAQQHTTTVTTIHDVFAWTLPGHSSLLDNLIYKHWLPYSSPRTDAIITVSTQSQADILKYLLPEPEKINIIPYGVAPIFRPNRSNYSEPVLYNKFGISRPYVLYVGALTQRKNLVRLLQAFKKVSSCYPELLLVLAGPRSWKQSPIESTIVELDLAKDVLLTGPLTDKELPELYNGADLFVFPSLYEGFGLPVLEAMACGTPVVTSNTSSLPEVAGEAALLVDPTDVEALANAMIRVLADPVLAARMREQGLCQASQFTWERTARETVSLYERTLANSPIDRKKK